MKTQEITFVRIYLREGEHVLAKVIDYLHDKAKVRGVTVLRGIEGFSDNGEIRTSFLLDLSMDLPLIVEFYDDSAKAETIIATLIDELHLSHIISLPAKVYSRLD
jgi:PII-like signaling protein